MIDQNISFESNEDIAERISRNYSNKNNENLEAHRENYLLVASANLLSWLIILRSLSSKPSIHKVRDILNKEIKKFDFHVQEAGYHTRILLAARYCLCTAIDEAILGTSWGNSCGWGEDNLLSTYYKETSGGERFFIILETMGEKPEKNVDLLELMYVILSLGFKGKLYDKGKVVMEAMQYQLFQKISPYLIGAHTPLCFFMRRPQTPRKKRIFFPIWSSIAIFFAIFLITESLFEYKTYTLEEPILTMLSALNKK